MISTELALPHCMYSTNYQEYWMGRKYCLCEGYDCILGLFGMHVCTHYVYNNNIICVYVCVYMCVCLCVYVKVCMYMCMLCMCAYVCMCLYVRVYIRIYVCTCVHVYMCVGVCVHVCVVRVYAYMFMCVHAHNNYLYMAIQIQQKQSSLHENIQPLISGTDLIHQSLQLKLTASCHTYNGLHHLCTGLSGISTI